MNTSFLKTGLIDRLQVVDSNTGEVMEDRIKKYKYLAKNREQFYLVYSSLIGLFIDLSAPAIRVYCYMLMNHNIGSDITIIKSTRQNIAKALKISAGTVANALGEMEKKKLVYSNQRSIYKLNPRYAFQGSTSERNRLLKTILELDCPDC